MSTYFIIFLTLSTIAYLSCWALELKCRNQHLKDRCSVYYEKVEDLESRLKSTQIEYGNTRLRLQQIIEIVKDL